MKKLYFLFILFFVTTLGFGQSNPGDIAFIAFNADGNKDFAFVTLVNIPANTNIYFTDNEWNGTSFNDLNEGVFRWTTSTDIASGTVIVFNNLISSPSVNIGELFILSGSLNLAALNETLYALLVEPSVSLMPSPNFLAAISSDDVGSGGIITGTGLTYGTNFINFANDYDGFKYTGSKTGKISFSEYLPEIMNTGNWQSEISDGTLILPISTDSFSISTASVVENNIEGFTLYPNPITNGTFAIKSVNGVAKNVQIFSLLGTQVYNKTVNQGEAIQVSNLTKGIYLLRVEEEGKIATRKLVIN